MISKSHKMPRDKATSRYLRDCSLSARILIRRVLRDVVYNTAAAVLSASQCFNSRSRIPKVMFGCSSPSHMMKVLRAFHGVRASGTDDVMRDRQCADVIGDPACSYCPGDCVDDSINEVCVSANMVHGTVRL